MTFPFLSPVFPAQHLYPFVCVSFPLEEGIGIDTQKYFCPQKILQLFWE